MNIADVIKKCARDAVDASVPCDVVLGQVIGVEPVRIKAGELVIEGDLLAVSDSLLYRACDITMGLYEREVVIHEGLKTGDNVVLVRKSGGGLYVAVAKI